MNITEIAELLSALAALLTISLAFIELSSRSRIKRADTAIDIYADFLHIVQQLQYAKGGASSFAEKSDAISPSERMSYAKTHIAPPETLALIQRFEKDCISNFDYTSSEGKTNSTKILDFSSEATGFFVLLNTFYQFVLDGNGYSPVGIRAHGCRISDAYERLSPKINSAGEMLRKNLKKTHNTSTLYLIVLLIAAALFSCLCFLL